MTQFVKRVVRSDLWVDAVFEERLSREPDIAVQMFSVKGEAQLAREKLSKAHIYHISAAKDELPREWFANAELLSYCPDLLCVSAGGAGYDTVDLAACNRAGVLVVNQSGGGNAQAVAEHILGMPRSF